MNPDLSEYLMTQLPKQRWFASKSAVITGISPFDQEEIQIAGKTFLFLLVEVSSAGTKDVYFVPLRIKKNENNDLSYTEGLNDEDLVTYLYEIYSGKRVLEARKGIISGEQTVDHLEDQFEPIASKIFAGEQSNTTVLLDSQQIMKVYRRRTDYYSPDYQLTKALHEQTMFDGTPDCLGSIIYSTGEETDLIATIFRYVKNQGDCWQYFTSSLERMIEENSFESDSMKQEVQELAKLTSKMHNALASLVGENFSPLPVTLDDISSWLMSLTDNCLILDPKDRSRDIPHREDIIDAGRRLLSVLQGDLFMKTRIHGDYHLGQILKSDDRFYVIDFEGEPMRSLEYRRLRNSPLKDVAGMIRSMDYAVSYCTMKSDDSETKAKGKKWIEATTELFCDTYLKNVDRSLKFIPDSDEDYRSLLDFFRLDKAVYELNYEMNNRPTWINIPLRSINNILMNEDYH